MNKTLKKILIVIGLIVLALVIFVVVFFLKMKSEAKKMTPLDTKEVVSNIFSVKDVFVDLYLIKDSTQYIAVDAGNNADNVSAELKKLNIDPSRVIAVFLTHSDGDHVAALKLFTNASVYLSKQEEPMINGEKPRFLLIKNKIYTKNYSLLEDQQVLHIGNITIKGILTPGHTPGSMCYLVNNKYLFTGDALGIKDGKVVPFNKSFNMDTKEAIQSISKITNLPEAEYIFSAHHGYCDYKNGVKDWNK